jgi:putative ABC transport system permease protein
MWRITLSGVIAHRLRYALTALAVLLGVAFIAGSLVLTDTMDSTFDNLYDQIYKGTAAVVEATEPFSPGASYSTQRQLIDASLATRLAKVPGVKALALNVDGYAQLVGRDGKPLGQINAAPTLGVAWTNVAALNPLRILPGGHAPRTGSQIVIDEHSANAAHFKVGDKVLVLTRQRPATYTITGIVTWGSTDSPLGATITAFDPATAERVLAKPGQVNSISVEAAPGFSSSQVVSNLQAAIRHQGIEVVSGQAVTAQAQQTIHQALGFITVILLVFAFIALFVGSFVIFNTFSITVAQRQRELALLRAVGASRDQVLASVIGESLVIGLVASGAGVIAGIGLAVALKAGLSALGFTLPTSGLVLTPRTVIVGLVAGTVITVLSAIAPARRAATIPPVAALQDVAAEPGRPPARRTVPGVVVTIAGAAALAAGLFSHLGSRVTLVALGAGAVFIGVALLGPFIARPVSRVLGAPLAFRGTAGKLSQQNAMRNPSRSATTAAALMVGVALVSLTSILAASMKASVSTIIGSAVRADFVVSSGASISGGGLSPQIEGSLKALPEVGDVAGVRAGVVKIYGRVISVVAADPRAAASLFSIGVTQGRLANVTSAGIAISTQVAASRHLRIGSPVAVTYPTTGTKTYTVQAIYSVRAVAGDYLLPLAAAEANLPQSLDIAVYIKLAPGVSASAGRHAIEGVLSSYPNATLMNQDQYKAQQARQVDQLLNLVYGLLALAVVISLIGIANTLALSIYERTRELGLLRAVGMTKGQLRSIIRSEALIISLFGALEGLVLGTLFGWAIVAALHSRGVTQFSFPAVQLLAVTVLAGLAGMVAAIAPSRRAARLDILRAVTTE